MFDDVELSCDDVSQDMRADCVASGIQNGTSQRNVSQDVPVPLRVSSCDRLVSLIQARGSGVALPQWSRQ